MSTIIESNNLNLAYKGNEIILKDANFTIKEREFIFITGESGSGKSTLLKSLYGALKPHSGELEVQGNNMNKISRRQLSYLRKRTGIVFQDYKLINELTVGENIALPLILKGYTPKTQKRQTKIFLNHVKLNEHLKDKYPLELSGGEQQRVGLARALVGRPKLMLADEPTGNLDSASAKSIWALMEQAVIDFNMTLLVVTHEVPELNTLKPRRFNIKDRSIHESI